MNKPVISTCFYLFKSKFNVEIYLKWIKNFLTYTENFFLVIYTDLQTSIILKPLINKNTKLIIKKIKDFKNYELKDKFIKNHDKNIFLNNRIDWKVNLLWCEKISFVKETIDNKYYESDTHFWCDIGYFREGNNSKHWPNLDFLNNLDKNKIYYTSVNNIENFNFCLDVNNIGLPKKIIPHNQVSVAGGFFIINKDNINWWHDTFNKKLRLYLENDYLVKDDQIIVLNCILENRDKFKILLNANDWMYFINYLRG